MPDVISGTEPENPEEARWPVVVATIAIGGLNLALPESLSFGPGWLLLVIVAALAIPSFYFHKRGNQRVTALIGYVVNSIVTLALVASLALLIEALPAHKIEPVRLL